MVSTSSSLRLAGDVLPYPDDEVVDGILDRAGGGTAKVVLMVGSTLGACAGGAAKVCAGWNIKWCSVKDKKKTHICFIISGFLLSGSAPQTKIVHGLCSISLC